MRCFEKVRQIFGTPIKTKWIGNYKIHLDIRFKHERRYFYDEERLDALIASKFIRQDDTVLDAGASIGYTALQYMRAGAKRVFAFEPVPDIYRRLSKLQDEKISTFEMALSDQDGYGEIVLSESHNQGHTLNPRWLNIFPSVYGPQPRRLSVRMVKLDNLFFQTTHFDFMKIDIEGSELALLKGARKLLKSSPPRVMQIEIYPLCFAEVHNEASRYFRFIKRVLLERETLSLKFIDLDDEASSNVPELTVTPPVYLYTNSAEIF